MVVHGHGQRALGPVLPDDVVVQMRLQDGRGGLAVAGADGIFALLLVKNPVALPYAFVADEGEMAAYLAFQKMAHLLAAFAAERAVKGLVARGVLLVSHEEVADKKVKKEMTR